MVGRQIAQYRIEAPLGEGGMGVVYRATDVTLDRTVAVKMLTPELSRNAALQERFQAEAKAQANLNHANIATLYNFVQEGDTSFIVMEYVEGETFESMLARGPIPLAQAIPLFRQALAGLGFAHQAGIIHRDVKPGNLMLNRQGVVKVLDFGLAKVLGAERKTQAGVRVGSSFYMSPEQIRNETLDARSDIYSLGVTLYEMLSGHVPFSGESDYQVMFNHVNQPPPPLHISPALDAVAMKAMEKDRERRFQNVAEFQEALERMETAPPAQRSARYWTVGVFGITVLALAFVTLHSHFAAAPKPSFDGAWNTVITCDNTSGARGYSYSFPSAVKQGTLHGEKGTPGAPGWLQLDGRILTDGSAKIRAEGLVGASAAAIGQVSSGTPYSYDISAKFTRASGTGRRMQGRACSVTFSKEQ